VSIRFLLYGHPCINIYANWGNHKVSKLLSIVKDNHVMLGDIHVNKTFEKRFLLFNLLTLTCKRTHIRKLGIGACLMKHFIAAARRRRFSQIRGWFKPDEGLDEELLRFYKRFGFEFDGQDVILDL
jgi:GNAT superfamily N-acetyltransferase